jgi:hypothetical protein
MRNILIKLFLFFKKEHIWKYVVEIASFLIIFALMLFLAANEVVDNVFGTIVGFMISSTSTCSVGISLTKRDRGLNWVRPNIRRSLTCTQKRRSLARVMAT